MTVVIGRNYELFQTSEVFLSRYGHAEKDV